MHGRISFPGELRAGETITSDPDHVWRPQGMDAWIVNLTVAGRGRIRLRDGWIDCAPGRLCLWPPGVGHHYGAFDGPWTHLWAYFHPRPAWLELLAWPEVSYGEWRLPRPGWKNCCCGAMPPTRMPQADSIRV